MSWALEIIHWPIPTNAIGNFRLYIIPTKVPFNLSSRYPARIKRVHLFTSSHVHDKLFNSISAHGGLVHVVTLIIEGVTSLVRNSPKLLIFYAHTRKLFNVANWSKHDNFNFITNKFQNRKLFNALKGSIIKWLWFFITSRLHATPTRCRSSEFILE